MRLPPIAFRRRLRRESTDAEKRLWALLRDRRLKLKLRRQHTFGPYTLDFYCPQAKLCIEADGGQHFHAAHHEHDEARNLALAQAGIRVLRFTNHQILDETASVRAAVWAALHAMPPSP